MAENSSISWTDHTFNAWIGCHKVSPGCKFCYAEAYAERWGLAEWGPNSNRHLTADSTWAKPLAWNKTAQANNKRFRVFCSSLSDIMEDNPQVSEWRNRLFALIEQTPHLDWLLLTKRPENYPRFLPEKWQSNFPHNVWLGTTICNQEEYDKKYPAFHNLLRTFLSPVYFVSFEPLLGPITLHSGAPNWSIIGGESGFLKYARKMELEWVKHLIKQLKSKDETNPYVKYNIFFKQMGAHLAKVLRMDDKKGEFGVDKLPPAYDWLKIREVPIVHSYCYYSLKKESSPAISEQTTLF